MPHGGYHGYRPSKQTSGPVGMSGAPRPSPKPFVDRQTKSKTQSISTSDVATGKFTGGTQKSTPKFKTFKDAYSAQDKISGPVKGILSKKVPKWKDKIPGVVKDVTIPKALEVLFEAPAAKIIYEGKKVIYPDLPPGERGGGGYQSAYDKYLARKVNQLKSKKKKTFKSTIRDVASSIGVPSSFSAFGYGLMAGDKENIPLSKKNFTNKQLAILKETALDKLKEVAKIKGTGLLYQEPVIVSLYSGSDFDILKGRETNLFPSSYSARSLGNTLGDVTAYINNEGELIVTDYYDWETQIGLSNPDTGLNPKTVDEWSYTMRKQVGLYFSNSTKGDYIRPYKNPPILLDKTQQIDQDVYNISMILMDGAESLANIIGPKKYKEKSIFDVPEENRMVLNLGKIGD